MLDQIENLSKSFNTQRKGKLMTIMEEVSNWGGAHKSNDLIKNALTCPTLMIEPKGIDEYVVDDYSNFVFLTQHEFPVKVESGDKRFAIFRCNNDVRPAEYFCRLGKALGVTKMGELVDPAGIQNWYNYLRSMDISGFDPQEEIPDTKIREEIKERCVDPVTQYAMDVWQKGEDVLYHDGYKQFLKDNNLRTDSHTIRSFNKALKSQLLAGDDSYCVKRFVHKGFRVTGYRIHPDVGLDLVRKHLNNPTWEYEQVLDEDEAAEDSE